jgi:hypothetical protein
MPRIKKDTLDTSHVPNILSKPGGSRRAQSYIGYDLGAGEGKRVWTECLARTEDMRRAPRAAAAQLCLRLQRVGRRPGPASESGDDVAMTGPRTRRPRRDAVDVGFALDPGCFRLV